MLTQSLAWQAQMRYDYTSLARYTWCWSTRNMRHCHTFILKKRGFTRHTGRQRLSCCNQMLQSATGSCLVRINRARKLWSPHQLLQYRAQCRIIRPICEIQRCDLSKVGSQFSSYRNVESANLKEAYAKLLTQTLQTHTTLEESLLLLSDMVV